MTAQTIFLTLLAGGGLWASAEQPKLIPYPQALTVTGGMVPVTGKLAVRLTRDTAGARFAVESLWMRFQKAPAEARGFHVLAGVRGDAGLEAVAGQKRNRAALGRAEGYVLEVTPAGIVVVGADEAGLFYGLRTLAQLARPEGVPQVRIEDWPALRHRGLSVDISRGPVLTDEQMRALIRTLADFKMNLLSFYMEHVFPYRHAPLVAPETGLTAERFTKLATYARQFHVDLVPQQQTFGHLHNMLKLELYADMAETPNGTVLAAENERGYRWIEQAAEQLAQTFASPFLHIGSDETFELGEGQSRALVGRIGVGEAYMLHMQRVTRMLRPLGKRLMFWGDIALNHPELLPKLPKELIAMTWNYEAKDDFRGWIEPFRKAGMEVMVSPGLNNWGGFTPIR
ncbi:MAG: beta-N-acetylhexosaminidase [Acidobacteria bacterium]|nr:beta-N-acetylhexosaminidase [Acidobacteriota bacterium]